MSSRDAGLERLVGDRVVRVQRLGLREQGDQLRQQHIELDAARRRDRHDRLPLAQLAHREQLLGDGGARGGVDLGDDRHLPRPRVLLELLVDEPVARPDLLVGGDAEPDDVDVAEGRADDAVEPLAEQGARAVDAGGVDDDELAVRRVDDAPDGVARRLRLRRGDRDLLADEGVREGRLADVGAADEGGEAGAMRLRGSSMSSRSRERGIPHR